MEILGKKGKQSGNHMGAADEITSQRTRSRAAMLSVDLAALKMWKLNRGGVAVGRQRWPAVAFAQLHLSTRANASAGLDRSAWWRQLHIFI
jgi:hypothetical protein